MDDVRSSSPLSADKPIILVGTKSELRKDKDCAYSIESLSRRFVTREEAENAVKELGLFGYAECSAFTQEGVKAVFDAAITVGLASKNKGTNFKGKECHVL